MSHKTHGLDLEVRHLREADPELRHIRQAVRWRLRLEQPDLSPEQLLCFSQWLESPRNCAAFDLLDPIWRVVRPPCECIELAPDRTLQPTSAAEAQQHEGPSKRLRLVSEEAAYWYFLCVDDPSMLRSERWAFIAWLRRSSENIAELFKIAQLDGKLRSLKLAMRSVGLEESNVVTLASTGSPYTLHREISEAGMDQRSLKFKLAALGLSLMFGLAMAFVARNHPAPDSVVTTGASEWQHMVLADGTKVHIDARSKIEVEYTDAARIVSIPAGSAVFEVAKDPTRPFIARTHLIDVMAVGTRFGVSIDPGVTATVSEGSVKITSRRDDTELATLQAGEELRVSDNLRVSAPASVDAERKLQWANGLLILGGMTVAEGVEQLNRRNRTQIIVDSPELGAKVVAFASVKVDAPERYARIVAAEPGVKMQLDPQNNLIRLSE